MLPSFHGVYPELLLMGLRMICGDTVPISKFLLHGQSTFKEEWGISDQTYVCPTPVANFHLTKNNDDPLI